MDSIDKESGESNDYENNHSNHSSSSNLNSVHPNNDLIGKIKSKRKSIFKLMKKHNTRKKCSSQPLPAYYDKKNQGCPQEYSNTIFNLPQNLSLEQKDSSINNNPSQNNLDDADLFNLNDSFKSPFFEQVKDLDDKNQLNDQLTKLKISNEDNKEEYINELQYKHQNQKQGKPSRSLEKSNISQKQKNKNQKISLQSYKNKREQQELNNLKNDAEFEQSSESQFDSDQDNEIQPKKYLRKNDEDALHAQNETNEIQETNHQEKSDERQQQQYSRREKSLEELSKKFLSIFIEKEQMMISLDKITQQLDVERRRIYDIINILESLKLVTRSRKNNYKWNGFDQIYDTIQFFTNQIEQNEKKDGQLSAEQSEKKEKSLEILSIGFLKLFLNYKQTLSLEEAARKLSPNNSENYKIKTKIRRLYDIANVFKSLGLIKKVQLNETKKPAFQWIGITGLQEFYNSSKEKEDPLATIQTEETKKNNKIQNKEQVNKQKSFSNSQVVETDKQQFQEQSRNVQTKETNLNEIDKIQNLVNSSFEDIIRKAAGSFSQFNQDANKNNSQNSSGFLSNTQNSAFRRVSKSLNDQPQSLLLNLDNNKQCNMNQVNSFKEHTPKQEYSLLKQQINDQVDQMQLEEDEENVQNLLNHNINKQQDQQLLNQNILELKHLNEERELINLLEKMRLQNLITDKNENLTNSIKQTTLNSSIKNTLSQNTQVNTFGILNESNMTDNKFILQLAQQAAMKVANNIQQQGQFFNSQNSVINQNQIFNQSSAISQNQMLSQKPKKLIQDKPINVINKNENNPNTLLSLFDKINTLIKLENQNKLQQQQQNQDNNLVEKYNFYNTKKDQTKLNTQYAESKLFNNEQKANSLFQIDQLNILNNFENTIRNQLLKNNQITQIEQNFNDQNKYNIDQNKFNLDQYKFNMDQNKFNNIDQNKMSNEQIINNLTNNILNKQNINQIFEQKDTQPVFLAPTKKTSDLVFLPPQKKNTQPLFLPPTNIQRLNQDKINISPQQQKRKQSAQNDNNTKKEINNKKKQKSSFDRYNSMLSNNEAQDDIQDNQDYNQFQIPIEHTIMNKKEKFKTKSNSLCEDKRVEYERLQELSKINKDEDQLFYSPKQVMQCIKKRKKGQEEIISTSVSSNQSSDSKIQQTPLLISSEQFQFAAPLQPQQQQQKILQIIQQQQALKCQQNCQNQMKQTNN